jgi:hypothetical protein
MPNSSSNDKDKDKNNSNKTFQPEPHLETRDGLSYLPLKWRLAWLRTEQPEAQVSTRLVSHENGLAVFQARIKLPGGGLATGWGARTRATDNDNNSREIDLAYITEAENLALERALTVLGYGTEYSFDFDTPVENEPIALNVVSLPVPNDKLTPVGSTSARSEPSLSAPKPYTLLHATTEQVEIATNEPESTELDTADADNEAEEEPLEISGSNLRSLNSSRSSGVPPRPDNVTQLPTPASNRANTLPPRPTLPKTPAPTTPTTSTGGGPTIGSAVINERLRGIEDPALRLAIKQIYTEAHRLHGLDETKVDQRSIRIYKLPANELSLEQAEEYLERIKNAVRRNQ